MWADCYDHAGTFTGHQPLSKPDSALAVGDMRGLIDNL